jgi:hypothetical protein
MTMMNPPDMAMPMSGLPLCDCSMLMPSCIIFHQCVGNGCCLEDELAPGGPPSGTCVDPTPCQQNKYP